MCHGSVHQDVLLQYVPDYHAPQPGLLCDWFSQVVSDGQYGHTQFSVSINSREGIQFIKCIHSLPKSSLIYSNYAENNEAKQNQV